MLYVLYSRVATRTGMYLGGKCTGKQPFSFPVLEFHNGQISKKIQPWFLIRISPTILREFVANWAIPKCSPTMVDNLSAFLANWDESYLYCTGMYLPIHVLEIFEMYCKMYWNFTLFSGHFEAIPAWCVWHSEAKITFHLLISSAKIII